MTCEDKQELITLISKVPRDYNNIVTKHCEDTVFLVNYLPDDTGLWTEFQSLWHKIEKNLFLCIQDVFVNKKRKPNPDQPNPLNTKNKPIKISTSPKKNHGAQPKSSVDDKEAPTQYSTSTRNRTKSVALPSPQNNINPAGSGTHSSLDGTRRKRDNTDRLVRSKSATPPTMKKSIDAFKMEQKRKKESETGKNMDLKKTVDSKVGKPVPEQTEKIQKIDSEMTVDTKKTIMEMVLVEPKYKNRKKREKVDETMIRTNSASPSSMKYAIDSFKADLKSKKDMEKKNLGPVHSEKEIVSPREAKNRSRNQIPEQSVGALKKTGERRRGKSVKNGERGDSPGKGRVRMVSNKGEVAKEGKVGGVTGKGKAGRVGKRVEEEKENRENKKGKDRGTTKNELNGVISELKKIDGGGIVSTEEQSVEDLKLEKVSEMEIGLIDDDKKEKMEYTEASGIPEDTDNVVIPEDLEKTETELQNSKEEKEIQPEEKKKEKKLIVENYNLGKGNKDIPRRTEAETIQTDLKIVENPADNHIQMGKEEEKQNDTKPEPRGIENEYSTNLKKEQRYSWFGTNTDYSPEKIIISNKRRLSDPKHYKESLGIQQVDKSMVISPKGRSDGTVDSGNIVVQKPLDELGNQSDSQNVSEKSNVDMKELLPIDNALYHNNNGDNTTSNYPLTSPNSVILERITSEIRPRRHSAPIVVEKEIFANHIRSSSEPVAVPHQENRSYETFQSSSMNSDGDADNQGNPLHQSTSTSPTNKDDSNMNDIQKSRLQKSVDNKRNMYANFRTVSVPSYKFSGDPQSIPVPPKKRPPKGAYESPEKLQLRKPFQPFTRAQTQPNKTKRKKTGFGITVLSKSVGKQEDPKPETRPELNLPLRKPPKKNGSIQSPASTAKMNSFSPMSNALKNTKEHLDNSIGLLTEEELSFLIDHLVKSKAVKIQQPIL